MNEGISELYSSPLFHFSLHSKELFHSNFLEWLSLDPELRPVFKAVMKGVGIDNIADDFEVCREKYNLDLIVKAPDREVRIGRKRHIVRKWYAVIENKVKSVPSQQQLQEYTDKIVKFCDNESNSVAKILLTLGNYNQSLPNGWRQVGYSTIIDALDEALPQVQNPYKKAIISDYITMVDVLSRIVGDIGVSGDSKYLSVPCKEIEDLRISDMIDKYRSSYIANTIISEYKFQCSHGYTNKQSLIEFNVEVNGISMGVQIQGAQYRHYIVDKSELDILRKSDGFLCATRAEFRDKMLKRFPDVFSPKKVKGEQNKNFCSYAGNDGKTFWYQYVIIKPEATINQVIQCLVEDAKYLQRLNSNKSEEQ